jgi:hypothetical protein
MRTIVVACLLLVSCSSSVRATPSASPSLPADWSVHDAAGLRIAAPAAWGAPDVLPATDASGGPRAWIVFHEPAGAEALAIMTWSDATAAAVAAAQYGSELPQGDRTDLTLGGGARRAIAVTGFAQWHDATAGGAYECRHLFVQVTPMLVADVIACGARIKGTATPTPELRAVQEQVALRIGVAGGAP